MTSEETVARLIDEGPFPANAAGKMVGQLHGGRPVAGSTISRWILRGHRLPDGRRIKLEALRVGGKLLTTKPAILRFFVAQQPVEVAEVAPIRSPAARRRGNSKTMDALSEAGAI